MVMNPSIQRRVIFMTLALLLPVVLTSCGGGAGTTAGGGSGGTGVGPVSGFGSVIVNGVKYSTDNANIVVGGAENRSESELRVGMRVRVDGGFSTTDNTGTAERIEAIREVRGPMNDNGVDNVANRLLVAGQTVLVNPATLFDNVIDLLELQAIQTGPPHRNPEVEVHGAADDNGFLHATYVRKGADDFPVATDNVEVRGKISGLAPITRFFINSLQVNYGGSVRVNVPLTGLANGMYVEVKGTLTAAGGSGTLNAARIEVLDNTVGSNNDAVRVEGYVVSGTSINSFVLLGPGGKVSVNGVGATLIPSTGSIGPGQEVQVEGVMTGTVLRASVVRIQPLESVRIEATVSDSPPPNLAAGTFVVLLNRTVQVNGLTRFKDDAGGDRNFSLSKLNPNDNVEVVGSWDGIRVTATLVERIQPSDPGKVLLQGPVDTVPPIVPEVSFGILGVLVTSNVAFANTEFKDASGNTVSMPAFFATVLPALQPDQVVKVKRGVFIPGSPSRIRDDAATRKMEVEIEQIND
jgi:hypothetical protein